MGKNTNLLIPEKVKEEAKIKAIRENISLSEVVSRFLAEWAKGKAPTPSRDTLERDYRAEGGV